MVGLTSIKGALHALLISALAALAVAGWVRASNAIDEARDADARLASVTQQMQQQHIKALDEQRARFEQQVAQIQEAQDAETERRRAAEADARSLRGTLDRVRNHAAGLAAQCRAAGPAPAGGGAPADSPGDLLADLSAGVAEAARELAEFAEDAAGAGRLCELYAESLKVPRLGTPK